jgi:hypothetical protein
VPGAGTAVGELCRTVVLQARCLPGEQVGPRTPRHNRAPPMPFHPGSRARRTTASWHRGRDRNRRSARLAHAGESSLEERRISPGSRRSGTLFTRCSVRTFGDSLGEMGGTSEGNVGRFGRADALLRPGRWSRATRRVRVCRYASAPAAKADPVNRCSGAAGAVTLGARLDASTLGARSIQSPLTLPVVKSRRPAMDRQGAAVMCWWPPGSRWTGGV